MAFLKVLEHQALLDELRTADETRITEIALALSENYNNVDNDYNTLSNEHTEQGKKLDAVRQQNNELFLAATAHSRAKEEDAKNNDPKDDDTPKPFLDGMFNQRGNLDVRETDK